MRLTNVIIMHLMPQLSAYPGQELFSALVEEVIDSIIMEFVDNAYLEEELEDF